MFYFMSNILKPRLKLLVVYCLLKDSLKDEQMWNYSFFLEIMYCIIHAGFGKVFLCHLFSSAIEMLLPHATQFILNSGEAIVKLA